jgi:ankyrin repeat protein
VKWLIEHGAPLEREDKQWGALHYAVFNGHEKVVSDLMARGANVNARAPNGATPLMLAAREGHDVWRGCCSKRAPIPAPERLG